MRSSLVIGAGAGLVAAALFASAATGTEIAGILFYLAPLPICLAGLGWGSFAAITAAISAALLTALGLGPALGGVFVASIGFPMALLCHLVLLARAPVTPQDQVVGPTEWYPVGRIVAAAAIIGGVLAAMLVLLLGYDTESYRETIKSLLEHSTLKEMGTDKSVLNEQTIEALSRALARALPAVIGIFWVGLALFNLWLGGLIIDASGRALRPWPRLDALELPNICFLLFVAGLALSFLPGIAGLLATGLAGALLFAYVLQGLAVLHAFTRGMRFRALLLGIVYFGIVLLGWVALLIAIIGISEPMLHLRQRANQHGRPPSTD